jgi:hypothetical protein
MVPYKKRADYFRDEYRRAKAVIVELRDMFKEVQAKYVTEHQRLRWTEEFLISEGYRRLDLKGNWTKEALEEADE